MALMFGAIIGALLRFFVYEQLKSKYSTLPTLTVNIVGSFLLGLYVQYGEQIYYSFFVIGLLASFTTFSTFSVDSVKFFVAKKWGFAISYIVANVVFCTAAIWVGMYI